ncbi:hypothetical protein AAG906_024560 [Vitis piasezkii]
MASFSAEVMLPPKSVKIAWRLPLMRRSDGGVAALNRPLFGMMSACCVTQMSLSSPKFLHRPQLPCTIRRIAQGCQTSFSGLWPPPSPPPARPSEPSTEGHFLIKSGVLN